MLPVEAALGLSSEAGEYLQLLRKWRYENVEFNEGEAIVELSDLLHYLMLACLKHEITLDDLARVNLVKMDARDKGEERAYNQVMRGVGGAVSVAEALDELETALAVVSR